MSFSELFGAAGIIKPFIAELLACQVENNITHNIEAVIISVRDQI